MRSTVFPFQGNRLSTTSQSISICFAHTLLTPPFLIWWKTKECDANFFLIEQCVRRWTEARIIEHIRLISNWPTISMVNWSIGNSSSFTLDPCARVNCNHGRCELDRTVAVCRCYAGFSGSDCLTPLGRFGVYAFEFLSISLSPFSFLIFVWLDH